MVQWLGLCTSTTGDMGSIPGQGNKIPQATWDTRKNTHKKKVKKKTYKKIKNDTNDLIYRNRNRLTDI